MEDYDDISVSQSQTVHHSVTELHSASGLNDDVSPFFPFFQAVLALARSLHSIYFIVFVCTVA